MQEKLEIDSNNFSFFLKFTGFSKDRNNVVEVKSQQLQQQQQQPTLPQTVCFHEFMCQNPDLVKRFLNH